jgi:hypothetical protein
MGRISLDQFKDWLIPGSWDERELAPSTLNLIQRIKLRLAEFSRGHWDESELRERLFEEFMGSFNVVAFFTNVSASGATSDVVAQPTPVDRSSMSPELFEIQYTSAA